MATQTQYAKELRKQAFKGYISEILLPITNKLNPVQTLKDNKKIILKKLANKKPKKISLSASVTYTRPNKINEDPYVVFVKTEQIVVLKSDHFKLSQIFDSKIVPSFQKEMDDMIMRGSGWSVESIQELRLNVARYEPLSGSSYLPLPDFIAKKRAVINVKNADDKCFMWSVLAKLHPVEKDPQRVTKYAQYTKELDFFNIEFPVKIKDIPRFEKQNDLTVNVYSYDDEKEYLYPVHVSQNAPIGDQSQVSHVDLFLMIEEEHSHYCYIKNFSRLMSHKTKHDGTKYFCMRCLQHFNDVKALTAHTDVCSSLNKKLMKVVMPEPNSKIAFKNIQKQMKAPFVVYADFESLLIPEKVTKGSQTILTQKHEICSYGYIAVSCDGTVFKGPVIYRGEDAAHKFLEEMCKLYWEMTSKIEHPVPIKMTEEEKNRHAKSTHCWICKRRIDPNSDKNNKVRDHCHMTGAYRGPAHSKCNLRLKLDPKKWQLPIFFHNLKGYDSHFIMQAVKDEWKRVDCIAHTTEKYMTFRLDNLIFLDSFQHMSSSLSKLADSLFSFNITQTYVNSEFVKKGVYPYEYVDDFSVFDEEELPPKEAFYSSLTKSGISDEDYEYAQRVWRELECETMGDYHDFYLKGDVCLLADVFESYRETCLQSYELDPAHYYTAPGMSWDAFLKRSNIEIDLFSEQPMFDFVERGLRGGLSMACHQQARANNPYLANYDPNKETNYIMYFDMNNLYGSVMVESLPLSDFKYEDLSLDVILSLSADSERGAIVEVDLEFPDSIHDYLNDYPPAPELIDPVDFGKPRDQWKGKNKKLIPTYFKHEKYVVHYRNLQYYLKLGVQVTKLHKVLTFKQAPFMKDYIEFNTEKRKQAKTDFEKDFYKLMNNSIFGKTMENVRNRKDIRLVTTQKRAKKLICQPNYNSSQIFHESLAAFLMDKCNISLDKPIFIGMAILDIAKLKMLEWYYGFFKPKYPKARVLYTDTDSLIIDVPTQDIYKEMNPDDYDTSDYPHDHPLYSTKNKKELGYMKDELQGEVIESYVGLRSKMYSTTTANHVEIKKAKGINKAVVKNELSHDDYKKVLSSGKPLQHVNTNLRSIKHEIYTVKTTKISLDSKNDKRVSGDTPGHYKHYFV